MTETKTRNSLVNIPPHVAQAICSIFVTHHLVRMPNQVDIESRYIQTLRVSRYQIQEPGTVLSNTGSCFNYE